ncbi:glycosyltransferase [Clostridium sp.]|uniref:glycosyltransferase n=1 Tax=Clostridium sp. TaxID=1506 RepID=UPI003464B46D
MSCEKKISICMMVKNEEKNIEKCLESLKYVLEKVPSELIILDTGSEDNTVNIAKKYTDKVYFEKWNNDFSDMRNKSIRYATGKWIFIIDADEVLEDANEINSFFNSGKYKRFNSGFVKIKSYIRKDYYNIACVPRLFKRDGDFRYKGKIHEQPIIKEPSYFFKSELIHWGYYTEDLELMKIKFERNTKILKEQLDKEPENIYYWHQLSQSYNSYNYTKEGLQAAEKAYEIAKYKKIDFRNMMYIYTHLALIYYQQNKYKELEELCIEALKVKDGYLDINYFLARAQQGLLKDEEAIKNYERYLEILSKYHTSPGAKDVTVTVYSLDVVEQVYRDLCLIYNRQEVYEKVSYYANKIENYKVIEEIIQYLVIAFIERKEYRELVDYYNIKLKDKPKYIKEIFVENFEEQSKSLEKEEKLMLWELFLQDDDYGILNKIRLVCNNKLRLQEEEINQLIKKLQLNEKPKFYGDIIFYILRARSAMSELLGNLKEDKLNAYCEYVYSQYLDEFIELGKGYIYNTLGKSISYEEKKFIKCLSHFLIITEKLQDKEHETIFYEYISKGIECIKEIYNPNVINNERIEDLKSDEEEFLLYISKIEKNKITNENHYINYLKKALKVYPIMNKGIKLLLEKIKENPGENLNSEFEEYKKLIKNNIFILLESKKVKEAKKVIDEYLEIMPKDLEMLMVKSEVQVQLI